MSLVCGNCGGYISEPDNDWPEVQCDHCGAYNRIVPECAIKNPQNPAQITFGEYLNYPTRNIDNISKVDLRQFDKLIKEMYSIYITPVEQLVRTLDYLYQVNSERSIDWIGKVSGATTRFPCNVIAMEILGNMNSQLAVNTLVSNVNFDYLRESLKSDSSGGSLLSVFVQSMAAYSNNKYSDINFAEFATSPHIPAQAIVAMPELIRMVQVELFRLTKVTNFVKRMGGKSITPLLEMARSRNQRNRSEIESLIGFLYLSLNYTDNTILTIFRNLLARPIKRDGDYVELIIAGNVMVEFSKNNPSNTTYYELINDLLSHKDARVRIGVASSIFYKNFHSFSKAALDYTVAYSLFMKEAMLYSNDSLVIQKLQEISNYQGK